MIANYKKKAKKKLYAAPVNGDPSKTIFYNSSPEKAKERAENYRRENEKYWKF